MFKIKKVYLLTYIFYYEIDEIPENIQLTRLSDT